METRVTQRQRLYPVPTVAMMALSLVFALSLLDWTGNGVSKPIWMFALPILCGALGSVLALPKGAYAWATASAVMGLSLLPLVIVVTTIFAGP